MAVRHLAACAGLTHVAGGWPSVTWPRAQDSRTWREECGFLSIAGGLFVEIAGAQVVTIQLDRIFGHYGLLIRYS